MSDPIEGTIQKHIYTAGDPVKVLAADGQIITECARIIKALGAGPDGELYYQLDTGSPSGWPESGLLFVDNLALALSIARRGWAVFPCKQEKDPYTKNGYKNATADPEQIKAFWRRYPGALVGLPCSPNGIFAVDIDIKNGINGLASWFELVDNHGGGEAPACGPWQQTPSGGHHLIFKMPDGLKVPNNAGKLGPGLDLRSDGYICTGSLANGSAYIWQPEQGPESVLTEAPGWLLDLIRKMGNQAPTQPPTDTAPSQPQPTTGEAGQYWLTKALGKGGIGTGDETGFWLACQLRDHKLSAGEMEGVLMAYAERVPQNTADPFTKKDVARWVNSALEGTTRDPAKRQGGPVRGSNHNGHHPQNTATQAAQTPPDNFTGEDLQPTQPTPGAPRERRKEPLGAEYVEFLKSKGYNFRLCDLDDSLWVNDDRISDPLEAEIKTLLRDNGYGRVNVAADAWLAHARKQSFNPITEYLNGLQWDGMDHIGHLAGHITDRHNNISLVLRKWAIGAVARPLTGGRQNRVMVFEGKQGTGKSYLARWIASPLEKYFSEAMPDPDNKDTRLALATTWIWEIKELGAVTRRADRESLKAWLTLQGVTERPPFGKHVVYKSAVTSFIATVNDEGGFFNDPTGSRRYMTVAIDAISWDYSKNVNINQFWAQAVHLFKSGEDWNLNPAEQARVEAVNDEYEFTPPVHDWLDVWIEPANGAAFLPVSEIMAAIKANGANGSDTHISREISGWMKRHGYEDARKHVEMAIIGEGKKSRLVRGYLGVRLLRKDFSA